MTIIPRGDPPYKVLVDNFPAGRKEPVSYRQARKFKLAIGAMDYVVPVGFERVVRSVQVSFNTAGLAGTRWWAFYLQTIDPVLGLIAYQRYTNQHAYTAMNFYQDLLAVGLDTRTFQFDATGFQTGSAQGMQSVRLLSGDSFRFTFAQSLGDSVQALVLYEEYEESTY